jgi:hypothetical protein
MWKSKGGLKMNIDDILAKDSIIKSIEKVQLALENFEKVEGIAIVWQVDGLIYNELYGDSSELVGMLERAKFYILSTDYLEDDNEDSLPSP